MKLELKKPKSGNYEIKISGDLSIQDVEEMRENFLSVLDADEKVKINLEEVSGADLAVLQVLYSFQKTMNDRGKSLVLDGKCPNAVKSAAEDSGFFCHLSQLLKSCDERED